MKKLVLVPFVIALLAVIAPTAALAKGASEAEIVGPGLDRPIVLTGSGDLATVMPLAELVEAAGFYPAVFVRSPDPMLDERPAGDLGRKYTITYVMPGPNNDVDQLVQEVYPYAKPDPVTYTAPGQPFFGTEQTRGGWFVATSLLTDQLVAAGLPQNPPAAVDDDGSPWTLTAGLVALAAALAAGMIGAYVIRRRPATA
ncbi:MAG: hypothetical protein A2Y55_04090 [Actinobacteria bacterium RBG_16_68_12]|nr:MAG: hypothetical protein A2Y55_04090 [Actinobacteria bacterium RBG_16_68_12]